ncbi:MAG: hypothetical protein PHU04_01460 [Candidatus Peribacteraceae bacterium]|nr:hypothetical protein [Candidatus Peribacteraceae bacterium]
MPELEYETARRRATQSKALIGAIARTLENQCDGQQEARNRIRVLTLSIGGILRSTAGALFDDVAQKCGGLQSIFDHCRSGLRSIATPQELRERVVGAVSKPFATEVVQRMVKKGNYHLDAGAIAETVNGTVGAMENRTFEILSAGAAYGGERLEQSIQTE